MISITYASKHEWTPNLTDYYDVEFTDSFGDIRKGGRCAVVSIDRKRGWIEIHYTNGIRLVSLESHVPLHAKANDKEYDETLRARVLAEIKREW